MTELASTRAAAKVRVRYEDLVGFVFSVFCAIGIPPARARTSAEALCYGDLVGLSSHGLVNLSRLYLPLFDQDRVEPTAELEVVTDRGASALVDAHRGLGLWVASEAMDMAVTRAAKYGIAMISVRNASHFGCAGHHAARAVGHQMIGIVAANCGHQRLVRPPGGRLPLLGTNPFSVAAPAGEHHPFVLDMATTVVPTGRIREAARAGTPVPEGWMEDDEGNPVTDPAAFDRGNAHLLWLGGRVGMYKGFGLGLMVEVLAALVSGAGSGLSPAALEGDGRPAGRDDDVGFFVAAIAPGALRQTDVAQRGAQEMFGALLACPPTEQGPPVRYPGWHEGERSRQSRLEGVSLPGHLYDDLREISRAMHLVLPLPPGIFP